VSGARFAWVLAWAPVGLCGGVATVPEPPVWWGGLVEVEQVSAWAPELGELDAVVRRGVREAGLRERPGSWVNAVRGPVVVAGLRVEGEHAERLVGELRMRVSHPGGASWNRIVLRWYGAGERRTPELSALSARVAGVEAGTAREGTLLTLVPATPVLPGETVDVQLSFVIEVPDLTEALPDRDYSNTEDHGLYGRWGQSGEVSLAHVLPQLSRFDGASWDTRPLARNGEHGDLDLQDVVLVLDRPASLRPVVGGVWLGEQASEGRVRSVHALPLVRDTSLVLSRGWQQASAEGGGRTVRVSLPTGWRSGWSAQGTADEALQVWTLLEQQVGQAPWSELDLAAVPARGDALATELSTLVLLHGTRHGVRPLSVVAHEVAHQWWYAIVGSDSAGEPWVDEAVASWTAAWAVGVIAGPSARASDLMREELFARQMEPVYRPAATLPAGEYSYGEYAVAVYGRATLFLEELARRGGDERMLGALRRWYTDRAGERGTGEELMAVLREAFGEQEVASAAALWLDAFTPPPLVPVAPLPEEPEPTKDKRTGGDREPGGARGSRVNKIE
jgi:hypothetical protein